MGFFCDRDMVQHFNGVSSRLAWFFVVVPICGHAFSITEFIVGPRVGRSITVTPKSDFRASIAVSTHFFFNSPHPYKNI